MRLSHKKNTCRKSIFRLSQKYRNCNICLRWSQIFLQQVKNILTTLDKLQEPPSIVINLELIERVGQAKYLGVILDDVFKFHAHIDWVIAKVAKKCGK